MDDDLMALVGRLEGLLEKAIRTPWVRANLASITTRILPATMRGAPYEMEERQYRGPADDVFVTEAINALPILLPAIKALVEERDEARSAWREATEGWDLSIQQSQAARSEWRAAEARCARLIEERLKLDRRIHNQRRALRENWMITEKRGNWAHRYRLPTTVLEMFKSVLNRRKLTKCRACGEWSDSALSESPVREGKA